MKKRITIKDIAKELNVHHSTVSRALRNDPKVNEKTRNLILEYARHHGYQTNMNAVQLRGNTNNTIALIVPNINHSFFSDIISHLTNLAYEKGYVISVFQTNEKYLQEKEIINTIIRHNFAGVIVSIAKDTTNSDHFSELKKFGIPMVFFDRVCEDLKVPKVLVNNYEVTFEATEYLINKGYDRIVHVTGTNNINVFRNRQNGYSDALTKNNVTYRNAIIVEEEFTVELGKKLFYDLWESSMKPNAFISSSVHLATGILLQARQMGINIPHNLGIITFGNQLSFEIQQPQITFIDQPEHEIAELSFELLENMMNQQIESNHDIVREVKAKIIFRESC
jgi:LacI family transcriptional regulator